MRLLFVIPHYFGPGSAKFGSCNLTRRQARADALRCCISSLHQQFGGRHEMLLHDGRRRPANRQMSSSVDVVICVRGSDHLLADLGLSPDTYRVYNTKVSDPRYLGYACYDVLRDACGRYDWYCFLEDDLVIRDPLFFNKLNSFYVVTGDARYQLLPHRFELGDRPVPVKAYIDGPLWDDSAAFLAGLRLPGCKEQILVPFGTASYPMVPAENPHAGCFFLTETHLRHLLEQPWYGTPVVGYAGPLESAATMSILTLFHLFKPADEYASFLEVHHHFQKFVGTDTFDDQYENQQKAQRLSTDVTIAGSWRADLPKPG